jgi:transcription factor E2F4/5
LQWAQQSIKNILDDISNYQLAYVTHEDICDCFSEQTLLAIQASNVKTSVPDP